MFSNFPHLTESKYPCGFVSKQLALFPQNNTNWMASLQQYFKIRTSYGAYP